MCGGLLHFTLCGCELNEAYSYLACQYARVCDCMILRAEMVRARAMCHLTRHYSSLNVLLCSTLRTVVVDRVEELPQWGALL